MQQNPIEQLQLKLKELENAFKAWLAKQSLPVKAGVVTTTSGVQGAAIGAFMGTLSNDVASTHPAAPPQAGPNPQAMASLMQAQSLSGSPLVQAHNFALVVGVGAVISCVGAGISCVIKRLRGNEDVESRQKMNSMSSSVSTPKVGRQGWYANDAKMLVSKTESNNPRRRFRGRPNFRSGQGCEVFDDPAIDEHLRETVSEIREEISEIDSSIEVCNEELRSMKEEMKEVRDKCIRLENKLGLQTKLMFVVIIGIFTIFVVILMGNVNP